MTRTKLLLHEPVTSPRSYAPFLAKYGNKRVEHFIVTTLNGAHIPVHTYVVTIGLVNRTVVHPREVFWYAIKDMATAIVVAHNHPSGQLQPSPEDIDITHRLSEAGKIIGIQLLDHIILGKQNEYYSMVEHGLIETGIGE